MILRKIASLMLIMLLFSTVVYAVEEYPLFEGAVKPFEFNQKSSKYEEFGQHKFRLKKNTEVVNGKKYELIYRIPKGTENPGRFLVVKNYSDAIQKMGGSILNESNTNATYKLIKNNNEIWIELHTSSNGYRLIIVEKGVHNQTISANPLYDQLNNEGKLVLYINFETGSYVIKKDSYKVLDDIVAMMMEHPELKISVEGHTDNTGNVDGNQRLSDARAIAVKEYIIKKGINDANISSKGYGRTKPIAENDSEEGRAKNRRVEIIKVK